MSADLAMQRAIDRFHQVGFGSLTLQERTLACIWYFEARVANGGFEHFFLSPEGYLAPYAPDAFRAIGSLRRADIAERANAVFGPGGVPKDRDQRMRRLKSMPIEERAVFDELEAEYYAHTADLDERIEAYLGQPARAT